MKMKWVAACVLLAAPSLVEAKVFEVHAQAQGGGGSGLGLAGAQKEDDFFAGAAGGLYGARMGMELFWIDAWLEHNQYHDGSEVQGTWTQLMAGLDLDAALSDPPAPGQPARLYGELGLAVGFGVGTGRQVEPPLDNGEITDKGFLAQVAFGMDYRLSRILSVGVAVPVTYGYLFKNGTFANDQSSHYQSVNGAVLLHVRCHFGVK